MTVRNRSSEILGSTKVNGIDFIEVDAGDPTILHVHFLNTVEIKPVPAPGLTARVDGGDSIPTVKVRPIVPANAWSHDAQNRPILTLRLEAQGDFSDYRLTLLGSPKIDRMFRSASFSFKAFCPSDFDCQQPGPACPPDDMPIPPIDYLAKDYLSFRRALLEYSALAYPAWRERSEADFGVMFAEALSALADELSYQQDRVAAETSIETATQRRSVTALARLVDYEPRPATSAHVQLRLDVAGPPIPAGALVGARTPEGEVIPFEIGTGLTDASVYPVNPAWNAGKLIPYWWDDEERCLPRKATEMWLLGHGHQLAAGVALLIQTDLPGESLRQIVHLTEVEQAYDAVFLTLGNPTPVTRIAWRADDALTRERDLTRTSLAGNLLPATQGQRRLETVAIDTRPFTAPDAPLAIARRGPNGDDRQPNFVHRHPLAATPLAWLADGDDEPTPEISVRQVLPDVRDWTWTASLLEADSLDEAFTLDAIAWRPVGFDNSGRPTQWDIDGDQGVTVRFGDGVFGLSPTPASLFEIRYRTGLGALGNVAADSIDQIDPAWAAFISAASNPFAAEGGAAAETLDHVRRMAPQAFRARQFRAVRSEDYVAAAEELSWVQQAGSAFRWTGSWFTAFTAADPKGSGEVTPLQHLELVQLLNRRRMAGVESYSPPPRYASVDLEIEVCVSPDSLPGDVEKRVVEALSGGRDGEGTPGFFHADRFTFGSPLQRSRLEAAIQRQAGVSGVLAIRYRKRGTLTGYVDLPDTLPIAPDEILRVDNDPDWPERGVIRVYPEGGR
ncbi:hypothetical protein QO010_002180 [Caulobacter ginsengisoli]|uniref:Baseplate protein J-like domain-containing protein n=1 Tax=Caulobacter ginsengisoli TaxID=400775 RepID=A0ABU0ITM8_9CAUL|nr:hypothetical protein [Caulobacter ginsengisoli]MDQ0464399.1 hypothetical protein [Caulobacter ginsengisoli]